jgi:hypothetical protein
LDHDFFEKSFNMSLFNARRSGQWLLAALVTIETASTLAHAQTTTEDSKAATNKPSASGELPLEIGSIVGAYVVCVALVGVGVLLAGRRRRRILQRALGDVEMTKRKTPGRPQMSKNDTSVNTKEHYIGQTSMQETDQHYPGHPYGNAPPYSAKPMNDRGPRPNTMKDVDTASLMFDMQNPRQAPGLDGDGRESVLPPPQQARGSRSSSIREVKRSGIRGLPISSPMPLSATSMVFNGKRASDEEPLSNNASPPPVSEPVYLPANPRRQGSIGSMDSAQSRANSQHQHPLRQQSISSLNQQGMSRLSPRHQNSRDNFAFGPTSPQIYSREQQQGRRSPQSLRELEQRELHERNAKWRTEEALWQPQVPHSPGFASEPVPAQYRQSPRPGGRASNPNGPSGHLRQNNSITSIRSFSRPIPVRNPTPELRSLPDRPNMDRKHSDNRSERLGSLRSVDRSLNFRENEESELETRDSMYSQPTSARSFSSHPVSFGARVDSQPARPLRDVAPAATPGVPIGSVSRSLPFREVQEKQEQRYTDAPLSYEPDDQEPEPEQYPRSMVQHAPRQPELQTRKSEPLSLRQGGLSPRQPSPLTPTAEMQPGYNRQLPLRSFSNGPASIDAVTGQAPSRAVTSDRIQNTVLERKPKQSARMNPLSPNGRSHGLLSPTTPFTPFSPMLSPAMPVSPRLVTKNERKQMEREMGSLAQELAKSDNDLWGS